MAAIYHPGVVTVIPHYDIGHPTNAANVIQWQTAAVGLTIAQLTAIQTAFDGAWSTGWKSLAYTGNRYMGSWVIDASSATGAQVTNASYTPVAGLTGSGSVGDQVAMLCSLKTPTRYRGGHGRVYIPGFGQTTINADGQTWTAATLTAVQTLWTNTQNAMGSVAGAAGGPLSLAVWHKKLASAPNSVEIVSAVVAQSVTATQRRRLRKVSRHHRRL